MENWRKFYRGRCGYRAGVSVLLLLGLLSLVILQEVGKYVSPATAGSDVIRNVHSKRLLSEADSNVANVSNLYVNIHFVHYVTTSHLRHGYVHLV